MKKQKDGLSFAKFIRTPQALKDLKIILGYFIAGYFFLKICYPFPDMTASDSGGYVAAAIGDLFYVYRPFGFYWFLQVLHAVSSSIHAVFICQHILHFTSVVFFIWTVSFFLPPKRNVWYYTFIGLCCFSPFYFYMSNSLLSDSLFATLTTFWLTTAIWVVMRPAIFSGILHALLLFWLLHTRYIAFFYPFLSFPFFIWLLRKRSLLPVFFSVFAILVFYNQTCNSMEATVGKRQFSTGFSGWQTANNALHVIPHIDLKTNELPDARLRVLHQFVMHQKEEIARTTAQGPSASFLWSQNLPLKQYLFHMMEQNQSDYLRTWVKAGDDFGRYGNYLISHYPFSYLRHYFLPNLWCSFYPPTEGYANYNYREIFKEEIVYYRLAENTDISARWDFMKIPAPHVPLINLVGWIFIFILLSAALVHIKKIKFSRHERIIFWFLLTFGITYIGAVTYGSPIAARYFLPLVSVKSFVIYLLLNHLPIKKQPDAPETIKK